MTGEGAVAASPSLSARVGAAVRSGPLASRPFLLLSSGQVTSTIGDYFYAVALPWLVLSSHGGAVALGAVLGSASRAVFPAEKRVNLAGDSIHLQPRTAISLSMAAHELATNAIKYGALSAASGRVSVRWSTDGGRFVLITQFLVIIVILLIRPRGIAGMLERTRE